VIEGHCHCGNIKLEIPELTESGTSCNCSICSRYGSVWGYFTEAEVKVTAVEPGIHPYSHGDKQLVFNSCEVCGCTTHYTMVEAGPQTRLAVNYRMFGEDVLKKLKIRIFDGAATWKYLD